METFTSLGPTRLDELLQVPLKLVPLQDFLREKASSVSPHSSEKQPSAIKDRLCRSADNKSPSDKESQNNNDKPSSLSSPCIFDCCRIPSKWGMRGPISNIAKFRSAELKLPDGSTCVVPVMDCSEETLSDIEMREEDENVEKAMNSPNSVGLDLTRQIIRRSRSKSSNNSDEVVVPVVESPNQNVVNSPVVISPPEVPPIIKPRRGRPPKVLVGKVLENPTLYKDFVIAQGLSERNNNNYKEITRTSNAGHSTGQRDDPITVEGEELRERLIDSDGNTLKLTFYNEGRKQSEKEYRTNNIMENAEEASEADRVRGGEPYYFESRHGLQLSRVLLRDGHHAGKPQEEPGREEKWQNNYNNTQQQNNPKIVRNVAAINSMGESELERSSWEGLQISRCQKDSATGPITGRVAPLEREAIIPATVPPGNMSAEQRHSRSGSQDERADVTGEGETLINKHLQSVLSSLRYVKAAAAAASQSQASPPTTGEAGHHPNHHQQQQQQPEGVSIFAKIPNNNNNKLTPTVQISPPTQNNRQQHQLKASTIIAASLALSPPSNEPWPERTIARIPTRPYLLKNPVYEVQPQPQATSNRQQHSPQQQQQHQQSFIHSQQQQQRLRPSALLHESSSAMHSPAKRLRPAGPLPPPNIPIPVARYQQQQQPHQQTPHHSNILPQNVNRYASNNGSVPTGNGSLSHYPIQNPHLAAAAAIANSNERSGSGMMNYVGGNAQHLAQQQQQQQHGTVYGGNQQQHHPQQQHNMSRTAAVAGMTIPPPYHSPLANEHIQQILQNHGSNRLHDSLMVAAAVAVNASTTEPLSQTEYYERLRGYYEYYQRQQLDLPKVMEYYQKVNNVYPNREHNNIREEGMRRYPVQMQPQQQQHPNRHGEDIMSSMGREVAHHLMSGGIMPGIPLNRGGSSTSSHYANMHHSPVAAAHARQIVDISPPQTSPSSSALRNMQARYSNNQIQPNPNSHNQQQQQQQQQLHQIRQIQERERQMQERERERQHIQQQNLNINARYSQQGLHHQQAYHSQQQQQQHSQSQNNAAHHQLSPSSLISGNAQQSHNRSSAFGHFSNRGGSSVAAVAAASLHAQRSPPSASSINENHHHPLHHQQQQQQLRTANLIRDTVREPISIENHLDLTMSRNHSQHQITTVRNHPTQTRALSPLTHIPNFHKQTLELAIKNNFKLVANNEAAKQNAGNGSPAAIAAANQNHVVLEKEIPPPSRHVITISSSPSSTIASTPSPSQPAPTRAPTSSPVHPNQNHVREWPKDLSFNNNNNNGNRSSSNEGSIKDKERGGLNINVNNKELLSPPVAAAIIRASPIVAQQTSVIRRLTTTTQLSPPENNNINNTSALRNSSSIITQKYNQNPSLESIQKSPSLSSSLNLNHPRYNNNNYHHSGLIPTDVGNRHDGGGNVGILKRKINIVRNHYADKEQQQSPIPLIAGEEEIVPGNNVTPSTVLTAINPVEGNNSRARTTSATSSLPGDNIADIDERRRSGGGGSLINQIRSKSKSASSGGGVGGADSDGSGGESGRGIWQYDHVVLLDKRTKTHMCKRCYEILKSEQDIRNHLFCKMLNGYVRCHVCLQLLKSEDYSEHLQIHGVVRPTDEEGSPPI